MLGRCLILAVFSALSVAGPGLHYLPVFGFHGTPCSHPVVQEDCDHAHDSRLSLHERTLQSALVVKSHGDAEHEHTACPVCDYYAQGNVLVPHADAFSGLTPDFGEAVAEVGLLAGQRLSDYLPRGPPLSV